VAATLVEVDVAGVGGLVPARGVRGWLMEGKLFHPKIVATTKRTATTIVPANHARTCVVSVRVCVCTQFGGGV